MPEPNSSALTNNTSDSTKLTDNTSNSTTSEANPQSSAQAAQEAELHKTTQEAALQQAAQEAALQQAAQEAALPQAAQEAELQLIISQTPFMLTRCSADLRYLFVSPAYAKMLGRPAAEITGKSILQVVGEEGFTTILPHIEKVLGGEIVEYETDVAFHGVGVRNLHVIYSPDRNSAGEVTGWVASIRDLTDTKRTQDSLAESLRREQVLYRFVDRLHRAESDTMVYEAA